MKKTTAPLPDFFAAKQRAGECLAIDGNRLLLIEALMLFFVSLMLYGLLDCLALLSELPAFAQLPYADFLLSALQWLLAAAVTLLLVSPLFLGILYMAGGIAANREVVLSDAFFAFRSAASYAHALALSFCLLWRIGVTALAVGFTVGAASHWFAGSLLAGLLCGILVLAELFAGFALCMRVFPLLALSMGAGDSAKVPPKTAKGIALRSPHGAGWRFFFGFLPHILLGLLTFGIYLVWDVIPRMCTAYFLYCYEMNETIIRTEE